MSAPSPRTSPSPRRPLALVRHLIVGALALSACGEPTATAPTPPVLDAAASATAASQDALPMPDLASAAGGALTNGATHTGQITLAGQVDTWTFTATQGNAITLGVGETSGTAAFTPWIRLTAPNGTVIGNTWGASASRLDVAAPATGTYRVSVASGDGNRVGTGGYRLTLVKAPGTFVVSSGDQGGALTNGANHAGAITTGDVDVWTFSATQGNALSLSVGEVTGDAAFTPWIVLVGPTGAIVGNSWGAAVAQVDLAAPATGSYTAIIGSGDGNRAGTGSYSLTLAQSPGTFVVPTGEQGGALTNGAIHAGTIALGDLDMWSFSATQGNAIALSVGEVTGNASFTPWIRLVSPTGAVIGNHWGAAAAQIDVAAPATGTYTVIIGTADGNRAGTGDYRLTMVKAPGTLTVSSGDQGGAIANGANVAGSIALGDLDAWTFTATQGNALSLSVGEVTGNASFTPWIRLVSPTGAVIGNSWGASVGQVNATAPATGTYTVIIGTADGNRAGTGSYTLTLAKAPGAFSVSSGDQGGALHNGSNPGGTIVLGDLDLWSFGATQGSAITLTITETTGNASFTPWIRLVAPNGAIVGNTWGAATAQIRVTASMTGTYTLIVGTADGGRVGTGTYGLTLVGAQGVVGVAGASARE